MKAEYPLNRRQDAPGRVFIVWDISYRCNYSCYYCPTHEPPDHKENTRFNAGDIKKLSEYLYRNYNSCHIRFSGGEPFCYPDFIEIIRLLSEYHFIEISTNLSFDINEAAEKLNPEVFLLSSSFHPQFVEIDEFIKKVNFLREKGFDVSVTFVAYPLFIGQMEHYKSRVEKNGIQFIIQPYDGEYKGIRYPGGYSAEEKQLLQTVADISLHSSANKKILEFKTGISEKRNEKICRMGQMYARIDRFGDVYRCCAPDSLKIGNINEGRIKLLDEAMACDVESCPCWKAMIVGEEDSWIEQWNYPAHPKRMPE